VGDQGPQAGYVARADSIRLGSLEFRNCIVQVTERKDMGVGVDGLIGTDVFSNYLVTLDYPMRKLLLSQLPPRPGEAGGDAAGLSTDAADPGSSAVSSGPQDRYIAPTMKDYYPVFRSGHYLILPTLLNNKTEGLFMVDSGAFSSSISPEAAGAVTKVHGGAPITIKGLGGDVAKVSTSDKIVFQFAGIQQQNIDLISFDTSGLSKAAGIEISGFLGNTVLRELTISIDYRDGLIKFAYDPKHGNHNF
jgi:hypothetical protein